MARKLATPKYKSFRLQKRIKSSQPKLPNVLKLSQQTLQIMKQNKRFFLIFILVYGLLSFILVQSSSGLNTVQQAKELVGGQLGNTLPTNVLLYVNLITVSTQFSNQLIGLYQFILVLIFSLAFIYGLRHMYGKRNQKVSVKESLYKGMTPLVPILLILLVLALELLPLSLGSSLYATVVGNGLAVVLVERIAWTLLLILLALLSLYLLSGSLFALFIITLPDMTPMRALRNSRELVRHRRLEVIRKIIFVPIVMILVLGIVVVPFIAWLPGVSQIVFYVATAVAFPLVLTYMYNLYRSML